MQQFHQGSPSIGNFGTITQLLSHKVISVINGAAITPNVFVTITFADFFIDKDVNFSWFTGVFAILIHPFYQRHFLFCQHKISRRALTTACTN
ncbi:hypothetical protein AX774_g5050 [Zancudomyces culisetae]|uniref:Uncharacterized protein n=1 Tax=Zancudomyces culisetae TaxID=1213189 RepID=A0A1R1PKN4_ZANCU|nr:hypothetical protein AX774_g5050 [Zancudomyces culisetae]|eukprot:OMH81497.1 hypothetical protein AX774_g5050 [Zancudomyces culisetae]